MRLVSTMAPTIVACLAASLAAQNGDSANAPQTKFRAGASTFAAESDDVAPTPASAVPESAWRDVRVPIHTQAADPQGGEYGIWAAGTDYKVSFHDGFTFVPYLGAGYPVTQPLRWETVSVTVGGEEIVDVDREPEHNASDYRYEYHYGSFVEAYDVRAQAVEQTFTLAERPAGAGDLIVEGKITSALDTMRIGDQHGRMTFYDDRGNAILHYGEAFALDAADRRIPITSSYDGETIRLRVSSDFVQTAQFPLTIDPLLSRECIAFWGSSASTTGLVTSTDVGRDDSFNQPAVAYTRNASAGDGDLWVWLFDDDTASYTGRNQIFTDITTSWDTTQTSIGFQGGTTDTWVVAFTRVFSPTSSGVRAHLHASNDKTLATSYIFVSPPVGTRDQNADVGGTNAFVASDNAMVVFERVDTTTLNRTVYGSTLDVAVGGFGTPFAISSTGTQYDSACPAVNQVSAAGGDGWVVVYQQYNDTIANDDWDLLGQRFDDNGVSTGTSWVVNGALDGDTHRQMPKVEGQAGRYLVTMTTYAPRTLVKETIKGGETITAERVDWPVTGSPINGSTHEVIRNSGSRRWNNTGLAYNSTNDMLWTPVFHSDVSGAAYAAQTGISAGTVELAVTLSPAGVEAAFASAATFNDDAAQTILSYASDEQAAPCGTSLATTHPVYTQIQTPFSCNVAASATITHRPTHIPNSTSINGVPYHRAAWNVFAQDTAGCVPVGSTVFFLVGASAVIPGPVVGGFGCGPWSPGEVNCLGPFLVPGAAPWDGSTPIGMASPINISTDTMFCGASIAVQPFFVTAAASVDMCGVVSAVIGL